jgi:hypothetical protein
MQLQTSCCAALFALLVFVLCSGHLQQGFGHPSCTVHMVLLCFAVLRCLLCCAVCCAQGATGSNLAVHLNLDALLQQAKEATSTGG